MQPRPYSLHVEQSILDDLRLRLRRARLPPELGAGWRQGTSRGYLRDLIA